MCVSPARDFFRRRSVAKQEGSIAYSNSNLSRCFANYQSTCHPEREAVVEGSTHTLEGNNIIYQDGKLRYTATTVKKYNYVTIVTELIEGKGGTYELYFSVYDIGNNAPEQYYGLRPDEIAQHPEIKNVYWGFATVKPYVRADGTPSYQLVSYTPITYNQ